MAADPNATQLLPNTQPFYCNFNNFCRGGLARWLLAKGPARQLWVPLCDNCARSLLGQLPDGLLMHTLRAALDGGRMETLNRVFEEAATRGVQPFYNWPLALMEQARAIARVELTEAEKAKLIQEGNFPGQRGSRPTQAPSPPSVYDPRAVALQYLREHLDDEEFMLKVTALLEGEEPPEGDEGASEGGDPPAEVAGVTEVTRGDAKPADSGTKRAPAPKSGGNKKASTNKRAAKPKGSGGAVGRKGK